MIAFLSGLPRTGSTLLSAILHQNPDIHAEGNSAVCQLMWDAQQSCQGAAYEQLAANRRLPDTQDALVRSIPFIYYRDVSRPVIVDKCRSWTLPANLAMIRRYITDDPKVIVLTRPVDEIVESFRRLYATNGLPFDPDALLAPQSEPLMRSLDGVEHARRVNTGEFCFIEYADLCADPHSTLAAIYEHCGWEPYAHDFTNVTNANPEDDSVYGLLGMHDIRGKVQPWRISHA